MNARIAQCVEARRADILSLSRDIHAAPELAFEEVRTSRLLRSVLETEGFEVGPAADALPTSFRAAYGSGRPHVTFTAEMDALPGLGHACGHNIIGAAGVYAAVVLKAAFGCDIPGAIEVVATPAEERGSGKVRLIQDGIFGTSDVVLQIHPHILDTVVCQALARRTLVVEFFGQKAHAADAPHEGRNALDALVLFYHAATLPRAKFAPGTLLHGIVESGGEAPNIVPDYSRGRFSIRADAIAKLERLIREVRSLAEKAAAETGCRSVITEPGPGVTTFRRNPALEDLFAGLFVECGRADPVKLRESYGSTDLANVSWVVPTIEPMIKASDFPIHTEGFARDVVGPDGEKALLDGVRILAAAAARILTEPALLDRIHADFLAGAGEGPEGSA